MSQSDIYIMVKSYLLHNGFDGLQNGAECGCIIKDLMPCGGANPCCTAGYEVKPPNNIECEFDFYICDSKKDRPWE